MRFGGDVANRFFEQPILNSPYLEPSLHHALGLSGRHAYFLGANDPYKSLKTALRAEIDEAAWSTLYRDQSRPFDRPRSGRIAVKVIKHFGDEVMKVFRV